MTPRLPLTLLVGALLLTGGCAGDGDTTAAQPAVTETVTETLTETAVAPEPEPDDPPPAAEAAPAASEAPSASEVAAFDPATLGDLARYLQPLAPEPHLGVQGGSWDGPAGNLMNQVVADLDGEPWWPLVRSVTIDEDMLVSDIDVELALLVHSDTVPYALDVCTRIGAAVPAESPPLAVAVHYDEVTGGGAAIDGTQESYEVREGAAQVAKGLSGDLCSDWPQYDPEGLDRRVDDYLTGQ